MLEYMKNKLSINKDLTPKDLTQKLVTLIGLTTIGRSSEIHCLTLLGMSKINNSYEMFSIGNKKHSQQGKTDPPIKIHSFPENEALCPVKCIDAYLEMTQPWRENLGTETRNMLWLSFASPHKPVSKPTITRWIISILNKAGIDTQSFKSHSVRAASSPKVSKAGLSTADILIRGNWKGASVWEKHYHKTLSHQLKGSPQPCWEKSKVVDFE